MKALIAGHVYMQLIRKWSCVVLLLQSVTLLKKHQRRLVQTSQ